MPAGFPETAHFLETMLSRAWPAAAWTDRTVLVAVSGGPDSVALLHALHRCREREVVARLRETGRNTGQIVVAHYNHRWRGPDSDADQDFVRALAASLGLACDVGQAADDSRSRSEESARNERYAFLLEAAHRLGARYIAAGHTRDDQAETILFRLLRGTGLSGLTGMPEVRRLSEGVTLVRPLLAVRRSQVLEYLQALGQSYQVDASNADVRFSRNRLRQEVFPLLQEVVEGDVVERLVQLGDQARELLEPIRSTAQKLLEAASEMQGQAVLLHLDRLPTRCERHVLREMFVELWKQQQWPRGQMSFERWEELADAVCLSRIPARMFPGSIHVEKQDESLVMRRRKA